MEQNFTKQDLEYIKSKEISLDKIVKHLAFFKEGISKINIVKCATKGNGIWVFSDEEKSSFINYFDKHKHNYNIIKFVPASGAASRMFKFLNTFLNEFNPDKETINAYINQHKANELSVFIVGLKNFPFYFSVMQRTEELYKEHSNFKTHREYYFIKTLLNKDEFNFANKPKAILPFNYKSNKIFVPLEIQIKESEYYTLPNKKTKIHFTISKEFKDEFIAITQPFKNYEITFSYQNSSTDTIAVSKENTPFRKEDGNLLFRPAGHGALIENLNNLNEDIIFIKNIDNISINNLAESQDTKKLIGGVLLKVQFQIFKYLKVLEKRDFSKTTLSEIINYVKDILLISLNEDFEQYQQEYQIQTLYNKLNKPIRVCGMVINEGEPGGGPFFVKDNKGKISLQIVETSQIDLENPNQKQILANATHFNPVDLVCGIRNYKNQKFNLLEFIDENAAFIVEKTKDGKQIKAYELPGLWNGAMANWITIFVEIPISTFNPVKTVNDLLKPAHQPEN